MVTMKVAFPTLRFAEYSYHRSLTFLTYLYCSTPDMTQPFLQTIKSTLFFMEKELEQERTFKINVI